MTVAALFGGSNLVLASGPQKPSAKQITDLTKGGGPLGRGFIENKGQWNPTARYFTSAGDTNVWITDSSIVYDFFVSDAKTSKGGVRTHHGHVVAMDFENSSQDSAAVGVNDIGRPINFIDKSGTYHAHSYAEAHIKGIYPGVNLQVSKENGNPRFDVVVAPGANVSKILVNYRGANGLTQNKDGTLSLGTSVGYKQIAQLHAFQVVNGVKTPVDVKFDLHADGLVGFKVGAHDKTKALTIDPVIYSTLIGLAGLANCQAYGVAVGQDSAPIITGYTDFGPFPISVGAYNGTIDNVSAFVTKFTQDGTHLEFSTVINSSDFAVGTLAQEDTNGRAIIAGYAGPGFPVHGDSLQTKVPAGDDYASFVSVLSADGSTLEYSSYIGGGFNLSDIDKFQQQYFDVQNIWDDTRLFGYLMNLQLDSTNRIYVLGHGTITPSSITYQSKPAGDNAYVVCLNSTGSLAFASYYGATGTISLAGAVSPDGGVYFAGQTNGSVPATAGTFQTTIRGGADGFITKLNAVTSTTTSISVGFTTYLGGSGGADIRGIAVDPLGEPYVYGYTTSIDFPITIGAFATRGPNYYVAKFNGGGSQLEYATYTGMGNSTAGIGLYGYPLAGPIAPIVTWIAIDPEGDCYLTGSVNVYGSIPQTNADQNGPTPYNPTEPFAATDKINFPVGDVTPGNAFMEVFNPTGTGLIYSSYWGGTYDQQGEQLAIDAGSNVYMVGWTDSFNEGSPEASTAFPTTPDCFDNLYYAPALPTPPTGFSYNPPLLPWNAAFNPPGMYLPAPMGFLTKFRVTNTIYMTDVFVPSVIPGGLSGGGAVTLSAPPPYPNVVPIEFVSSNQNIIPSFVFNFVNGAPPATPVSTQGFGINTTDVTVATQVSLTAYHDGIYIIRGVEVVPLLEGFSVAVPSIVGGNNTTASISLAETVPTPPAGSKIPYYDVTIQVTSTDPQIAKPETSTVTIYSGQSSALLTVDSVGVDTATQVTFSAQIVNTFLPNTNEQSFAYTPTWVLNVLPASVANVQFTPQIVSGGFPSKGLVVLNGQAGPTPITVNLTETTGTAKVTLSPTTVTVPKGSNVGAFNAATQPDFTNSFITVVATQENNKATASGTLFVTPITLGALQVVVPTITGGSKAGIYISLSSPAPPNGLTVSLKTSNSNWGTITPAQVIIPSGSSQSGVINVQTNVTSAPETLGITATYGPLAVTNSLQIEPESLTLTPKPTILQAGKGSFLFGLTLEAAEQNVPLQVGLTCNAPAALHIPSSISIPSGQTTASFTGTTSLVGATTVETVTATISPTVQGKMTASATVTITPLPLLITVAPASLIGGISQGSGTVTLSGPAAVPTTVSFSSNSPNAAYVEPASIVIPIGKKTGSFTVLTKVVPKNTVVTITAKDSQGSNTAQVTVTPPQVTLTGLTIANPSVFGGVSTTATLTYTGTIPESGIPMQIFSNESAAQVPATVTLVKGSTSTKFAINTTSVQYDVPVTITASYGVLQISGNMTVLALRTGSLSLVPSSNAYGGSTVGLKITIDLAAPSTGIQVQLSQSSALLSQPGGVTVNGQLIPLTGSNGPFPTITIPPGQTSVSVTLSTPFVASPISTTITGTFVGQKSSGSATLNLFPSVEWNP